MTDHTRLEDRLRDALRERGTDVVISPDAWHENRRRLALARSRRQRPWLAAAAAVLVVLVFGGLALLGGRGGGTGLPASGGPSDPWDDGNLLGPAVAAETVTVDGEPVDHEIVLSDTTGKGPNLCDRLVAGNSESVSCTSREPGADKPGVAFDWLSGTERDGDLRGVLAGADERVTFVDVWMSDGERVAAKLHPTGWEGTQMLAITVPADGPRPQRLVATGRDGNVLQAVDLPTRFGGNWLAERSACAGDAVGEIGAEISVLPGASVALGTRDARISIRLQVDDVYEACVERLRATALAGWREAGTLVAAVAAPEVSTVRLIRAGGSGGDTVLAEATPEAVAGSPWRVVMLRAAKQPQIDSAELIALDAHGEILDRAFVSQPQSP